MFSNFAQIFHNRILYYGVQTEEGFRFISSKKETLEIKDLKERGISFPTLAQNAEAPSLSFLNNEPWSISSIKRFLKSSRPIADPKQLFFRVQNLIKKFPHPGDEKELSVLTLIPFLSGLYSAFRTIPYFLLVGDPYSKQLLLDLLEKICFNGIRLNSPNSSLISRLIHLYGSTLIITIPHDNPGRHPFNNILNILEESCRSSGSFYVLNECGIPLSLPTYSLKILDAEIRSQYLKHLSIEIRIEKPSGNPSPLCLSETEELQELRDHLHILSLENVNSIFNIYEGMERISGLSNQHAESLSGIFSITKHLDPFFETLSLFDNTVTWAKDLALRLKQNQIFDNKNKHIRYLVAEFIQRFQPDMDGYYVAQDIARYINEAGDLSQKSRPEDITRRLKHFDPHRKRDWVDVDQEKDKKQRTKIKFDYDKLLKQVDA